MAKTLSADDGRKKYETMQKQIEALQTEIMTVQIKYQKELEKLEKENRELRQQYLIIKTNRKTTLGKKIKVRVHCSMHFHYFFEDDEIDQRFLKLICVP